jgi:hypothetical protein
VARLGKHLNEAARQPVLALDGLVGIRRAADAQRCGPVARTAQRLAQGRWGIDLGNQLGFKIQPW